MIQNATQATRPLAVFTPLGSDTLLLQRFVGTEEVSGLFHFRLDLLSEDPALAPQSILGGNVTFAVRGGGDRPRYFNGYVSRFEAGAMTPSGNFRKYRAEVVPWLWFLGRTTDCRIFQDETVPAIVRKVFRDLGFTDFNMSRLRSEYPKRVYCVQYRETDLAFVCRLLEEEGIYFYFLHKNGKHTLVLSDSVAGYRWCRQRELRYEPTRGPSPGEDRITAWEHRYAFRSGKLAHTDYNFESPSMKLMAVETSKIALANNSRFELYDYPGEYEQRPDGRRLARVRIEEEELPYDTVVGESTCPLLGPGRMFTYRDAELSAESGQTRLVSSVEHRGMDPNMYETVGESDRVADEQPIYCNQFTCIPDSVCFRPARVTHRPVMRGVQTAMVVGPAGEEIYPDEYGRVKVQFHWDREGNRDENSSCWLRVSQRHAGKGWGDIDLPRIGEEVIVDFLEGDPDRPIVKGRVYNAEAQTPFALPGSKTRSGGKTDTHQGSGYNEITMDDTAGQEQLRVNAQHNMDSVIGNNETLQIGVDRATDIGNNELLKVAVDGSLEVGNDAQIAVGNDATYVVGNNVEVTAGVAITLQCGASTIHMNQAGVITISGTFVTSAARANNAIVAPLTSIAGSNMLLQAGLVALDLGGVTHVKGEETTVAGASVSILGAGETILMGLPLMLGEVGAPLEGLPEGQAGEGSSAEAGGDAGEGSTGEANKAGTATPVDDSSDKQSGPHSDVEASEDSADGSGSVTGDDAANTTTEQSQKTEPRDTSSDKSTSTTEPESNSQDNESGDTEQPVPAVSDAASHTNPELGAPPPAPAEEEPSCDGELVVFNERSKYPPEDSPKRQQDLDNMRQSNEAMAHGRGADFTSVDDDAPLRDDYCKVTLSGHATDEDGRINANGVDALLKKVEQRGVDANKVREIEVASCGGMGPPYNSEQVAREVCERTGKTATTHTSLTVPSPDGELKKPPSYRGVPADSVTADPKNSCEPRKN